MTRSDPLRDANPPRPTMFTRRQLTLVAIFSSCGLTWLAGCGSGSAPNRVIVEGKVTFNGDPVANGQIYFYPTEENPGPVSGGPIKDGRYVAKARGGVPLGTHRVEITAYRPPKSAQAGIGEGGPPDQYLPTQFNQRSELISRVEASDEPKTIDFELSSK